MNEEVPTERSFLIECYKEKTSNFDNSSWIPERIKVKYRQKINNYERLLDEYTFWKFRFLQGLEQSPQISVDEFMKELEKKGAPAIYMREFVMQWKDKQKDERLAYLYRCTQLPLTTVHEWWYPQRYCYEWCELRQNEIKKIKEECCDLKKPWETELKKNTVKFP